MSKNFLIFFLLFLTVFGFGWGFYTTKQMEGIVAQKEIDTARAFYELTDAADDLSVLTAKAAVTADNGNRAALCAEIASRAYAAQENLSMLPVYDATLSRTERFLNQLGDYSAVQVTKAARNEAPTEAETKTAKSLNKDVTAIASALHGLDISDLSQKELKNPDTEAPGALTSLQDINAEIAKTPALIYDGPFSDHLENKKPVKLPGKACSEREVLQKAVRLFGKDYNYKITGKSKASAGMAVYQLALGKADKCVANADFSRNGGRLVQYTSCPDEGKAVISTEEALNHAAAFLKKADYPDLKAGYYIIDGNVLTANYTATLGDVILYPDMVKVAVDLTNGSVVGFDAKNYLEYHKERSLPRLTLTEEAAKAKLKQGINPVAVQKTLIPKSDGSEVFCYEFRSTVNGTDYLTYINAETGREEEILVVKDGDKGTFTL